MLLTYDGLMKLIQQGHIENSNKSLVNGASIDVTLGDYILVESREGIGDVLDLSVKPCPKMLKQEIGEHGLIVPPLTCFLAYTREWFNIPLNMSAEYVLKSSMARCFLEHFNAGWCDPGWSGQLTMEFKNMNKYHSILLRKGMKIGQMKFYQHDKVRYEDSYSVKGRYNGSVGIQPSKGVR